MQLLAAAPEWDDEIRIDQYTKMFGDALASHPEMATELTQSLSVGLMELIKQRAPVWISQSFKDIIHRCEIMQPNGCISPACRASLFPGKPGLTQRAPPSGGSLLQIKRAGPEVDDPVMRLEQLSSEKSCHRHGSARSIFRKQPFQISHSDGLTEHVE
jgi:hypothetical protein